MTTHHQILAAMDGHILALEQRGNAPCRLNDLLHLRDSFETHGFDCSGADLSRMAGHIRTAAGAARPDNRNGNRAHASLTACADLLCHIGLRAAA